MRMRMLGRTGLQASVVGFGGIIVTDTKPEEAVDYVAEAVELGVNYFDVGPAYKDAEVRLGPALEPYRRNVILAVKTRGRTYDAAKEDLYRSLDRLRTDYFDVYQFHHLKTMEEVENAMGPARSMELFLEAKEQGLVKHLGFTTHSDTIALRMMELYDFDTMLIPVNHTTWHVKQTATRAVPAANERDMGIVAIKAMAERPYELEEKRKWWKCWYHPIEDSELAKAAYKWTLSQDITVALPPGHIEFLRLAVEAEKEFDESRSYSVDIESPVPIYHDDGLGKFMPWPTPQ